MILVTQGCQGGGLGQGIHVEGFAGTINGETATGAGQFLTGDTANATTSGLQIQYTGSSTGLVGTIFGASRDRIAPSRRFYAGGGASVRGYGFQALGPKDPVFEDPIGGGHAHRAGQPAGTDRVSPGLRCPGPVQP